MIAASPAPSLFPSSVNSVSLCLALFFRPSTLQTRGGTSPRYRPALNHPLKRYSTILPLSVGCQLSAVSSPVNRLFVFSPFNFRQSTVNFLSAISFRIRTYVKRARNLFTMNTSKTQHLKSFRMNTYKKTGEGVAPLSHKSPPSTFGPFHSPVTSFPLKPLPNMAHLYLCTCKKGPAAREPRYSPCAAS